MTTILSRFNVSSPHDLPTAAQDWFYHNFKGYQVKGVSGRKLKGAANRKFHPLPKVTMPQPKQGMNKRVGKIVVWCGNCKRMEKFCRCEGEA